MKKVLFGIFAHPDDEAFGPSASLYNEAQNGTDIHLLLITDGENGNNPDNLQSLGATRLAEWQKSGQIIGACSQTALHYPDGGLSNNLYLEIAQKLLQAISETLQNYKQETIIEFMTYERGGLTGHLDHIAVSYVTTYVYLKLRDSPPSSIQIGSLKYYCLPNCIAPTSNTSWLFMEHGQPDAHCDEIFDYKKILDIKLSIMRTHHSQREDMNAILEQQENTDNACKYRDHFCYFKD